MPNPSDKEDSTAANSGVIGKDEEYSVTTSNTAHQPDTASSHPLNMATPTEKEATKMTASNDKEDAKTTALEGAGEEEKIAESSDEGDSAPASSLAHQPDAQLPPKNGYWSDRNAIGQVEYYFSDENLPKDAYLLAKCGGHQNEPVSLKVICGFPRMKSYKPYSRVVHALRKSTKLEVVDSKFVRRLEPLTLPLQVEPDGRETARREQKVTAKASSQLTDFEGYYADAPVTPELYQKERDLYDTSNAFSDRIEKAVQRFLAKRKFQNDAHKVLDKFLKFGGVVMQPRISGQMSKEDLEGYTAEEIAEIMAVYWCHEDVGNPKLFRINVVGVPMAFL